MSTTIDQSRTVCAALEGGCRKCEMPAQNYNSGHTQELHGDIQWLRHALAEDWLFSLFHPIVEADTGRVFGPDAWCRNRG